MRKKIFLKRKSGAPAADFFQRRAGKARPEDMLPFLESAANEPPPPGDEL